MKYSNLGYIEHSVTWSVYNCVVAIYSIYMACNIYCGCGSYHGSGETVLDCTGPCPVDEVLKFGLY